MKARIMLAHSIWNGKNKVVKEVLRKMRQDRGNKWNNKLNQYLSEINISFEEMVEMSKNQIHRKVDAYDNRKWYEEAATKRTLGVYRKFKRRIEDERIYDNRKSSEILFRARSNTMALDTEKRHNGGKTECDLCHSEEEDLQHFLLKCSVLQD